MAQQRVDWQGVDTEIEKTKRHHHDVTMTCKETDALARLKMDLRELGIDWKEKLCSREAIEEEMLHKSEELDLESKFIELMKEFDLFRTRVEELEGLFKDITANPTKSSANEYLLETWKHLKFMYDSASDIEELLKDKQTYFSQTLKDWVESKAESLLNKLNKILFYSQEIYLTKDQRRSNEVSGGAVWFELDLSTLYELKRLVIKQDYVERLSELIHRSVEKKLISLYDRYGHVLKIDHDRENHFIYYLVKPIMHFDQQAIQFMIDLSGYLQSESLAGDSASQVTIAIIDHYLQLISDTEMIDKNKYILQHKSQFESLINHRNRLACQLQSSPKHTDFDAVFRDLGFSKEASSENDIQVMLWNMFGRLTVIQKDISIISLRWLSCTEN